MNHQIVIALALLGLLLGLSGCGPGEERPSKEAQVPPPKPEDYPKLARSLFELATSQRPDQLAERAQLTLKDGSVQVVLELQGPEWAEDIRWAVEALGGSVQIQAGTSVQAWVPVKALLKLAQHPRVVYIRPPVRPQKD